MFARTIRRLLIGICFALIFGVLAVAVGEAVPLEQEGPLRTDCQECHSSVVSNWEDSAHSQALDDPVFQEAWVAQGEPADCLSCHTTGYDPETGAYQQEGVACTMCHDTPAGPHPEVVMPTDSSSRQCGTCHVDTYNEWEISQHGKSNMSCVRCHNPHTTDLKTETVQDLCVTCHNEEGHFYDYTLHAGQGLLCTDCHLRVSESSLGEGHGQRMHTFAVDLRTCTQCHGDEMHFPSMTEEEESIIGSEFMWSTFASEGGEDSCPSTNALVTDEPGSTTGLPLHYVLVAGLGLVFGIAVAPWAENWYRRSADRS